MDLLIKQTHPQDSEALQGAAVKEGKIIEVVPTIASDAKEVIEVDDRVSIPGSVESHLHLDKASIADRKPGKSGTLKEAIEVTAELKPTFTKEDIYDRAKRALEVLIVHGTAALGIHAGLDPIQGSTGFGTTMRLKEEYKKLIDTQVVAFPQEGISKAPGAEQMMYEVVDMGVDIIGGILYNDAPAEEHIDLVFETAKEYDKGVDLHQNFADRADDMSTEYLCEKTIAGGYQGHVSVGHLTALHALPEAELAPATAKIAETNISVMALPATDLHLGARSGQHNIRCTVTLICKLRDGGVSVCIATNNIRSAFTSYGTGNIVQAAILAIPVGHLGGADDLKTVLPMVTTSPVRAMGLEGYDVAVRDKADLVLLNIKTVEHVIIDIPEQLYVVKSGHVTVKTDKKAGIICQEKKQKARSVSCQN